MLDIKNIKLEPAIEDSRGKSLAECDSSNLKLGQFVAASSANYATTLFGRHAPRRGRNRRRNGLDVHM